MKIEREKIQLANLNFDQVAMDGKITGVHQSRSLPLTKMNSQILDLFRQSYSISEVAQHFLQRKELVSFETMRKLVQFLVEEDLILNTSLKNYFQDLPPETKKKTAFGNWMETMFQSESAYTKADEEIKTLPFFRSLDPNLLETMLDNAVIIDTPAGVPVCQAGELQRSLCVLLTGQASVYKRAAHGQKRKVAVLSEGSVFGEVGFFLGEARTADVVTDKRSRIVRFKYVPKLYDQLIQTEKARELQKRFWLIHALLKSETFKEIPDDCFDALIFSGELKTIPMDTMICREGEMGSTCYIMVQGSAVVSQKGKSIRVLGQGDCFGEVALIVTGGKRSATVQAQTEVLALEIQSQNFYQLMAQNLILASEFEKLALSMIEADQLRSA